MNKIIYRMPEAIAVSPAYAWVNKRGGGFKNHAKFNMCDSRGKVRKTNKTKLKMITDDLEKSDITFSTTTIDGFVYIVSF